jgi:hypothetical protein
MEAGERAGAVMSIWRGGRGIMFRAAMGLPIMPKLAAPVLSTEKEKRTSQIPASFRSFFIGATSS